MATHLSVRLAWHDEKTRGQASSTVAHQVLKEKEIKQYGEYRTQRLVLEAWDRLFGGTDDEAAQGPAAESYSERADCLVAKVNWALMRALRTALVG